MLEVSKSSGRQITDKAHARQAQTRCTWLPEHSDAMSVMDSLCSSRTSDSVILLPLLGTSKTKIAPDETPRERKLQADWIIAH